MTPNLLFVDAAASETLAPACLTMPIFAFVSGSRYICRVNCPCVPRFLRAIARNPTARTGMMNGSNV